MLSTSAGSGEVMKVAVDADGRAFGKKSWQTAISSRSVPSALRPGGVVHFGPCRFRRCPRPRTGPGPPPRRCVARCDGPRSAMRSLVSTGPQGPHRPDRGPPRPGRRADRTCHAADGGGRPRGPAVRGDLERSRELAATVGAVELQGPGFTITFMDDAPGSSADEADPNPEAEQGRVYAKDLRLSSTPSGRPGPRPSASTATASRRCRPSASPGRRPSSTTVR